MTEWTSAKEIELQSLYNEGVAFSAIAEKIGYSRNAVIGKVHRMELPPRAERTQPFLPPPKAQTIVKAKRIRHKEPRPEVAPEPVPDVVDRRCDIFALTETTCRYPMWATGTQHLDRLYCGETTVFEESYCPHHQKICAGSSFGK